MAEKCLILDGWRVDVAASCITRGRETRRLEPKVMKTLTCLADNRGDVVTKDTLFETVWDRTFVTDAALTRCIFEIRQAFDDDASNPSIVETIPKIGYRLIAAPVRTGASNRRKYTPTPWLIAATVAVLAVVFSWTLGTKIDTRSANELEALSPIPEATSAYQKGVLHHVRADYTSNGNAIAFFEEAVEHDPSFGLAHMLLANALIQRNRRWGQDSIDEAVAAAAMAVKLDATNADAYNTLGLAQLIRGDSESALQDLQRAYEINPTHWKSIYNAGRAHKARYEYEEAIEQFLRVVELNPSHFEAALRLGFLYLRTGDVEAARYWTNYTLEYAPESIVTWTQLAELELVTRNAAKAIEYCQRVLNSEPLHVTCVYITAVSNQLQGDMTKAKEFFEVAVANLKRTNYARLGIAQILIAEGREGEGMDRINEVLDEALIRAGGENASLPDYRLIAACFSLLGDDAAAMEWLKKYSEAGRRFPLWDAIDPVLVDLHGDNRFNRYIAMSWNSRT